jgi:hypothetical protein
MYIDLSTFNIKIKIPEIGTETGFLEGSFPRREVIN